MACINSVFQYFNANPKGKNTCDCVIRAIAGAARMEWEDVLCGLTQCAVKNKLMINDPKLYKKYLKELGFIQKKQPRKSDGTKYKGYEWAPLIKDVAIAHMGSHHIVMVNHGKVWDTWDSTNGIVGSYWIKE
jgi:hypothetical protein